MNRAFTDQAIKKDPAHKRSITGTITYCLYSLLLLYLGAEYACEAELYTECRFLHYSLTGASLLTQLSTLILTCLFPSWSICSPRELLLKSLGLYFALLLVVGDFVLLRESPFDEDFVTYRNGINRTMIYGSTAYFLSSLGICHLGSADAFHSGILGSVLSFLKPFYYAIS